MKVWLSAKENTKRLAEEYLKQRENQFENLALLQTKDTDKDGLSDYQEIYLYRTSPYLSDTDGDGLDDLEEIKRGENPNCPIGQKCIFAQPPSQSKKTSSVQPSSPLPDLSQISSQELRAYLKEAGASEELLNEIDDETLRKMFEETLKEEQKKISSNQRSEENQTSPPFFLTNQTSANLSPNLPPGLSEEYLKNLSPEEIRIFLKEAGIQNELIDHLDDEILRAIFFSALGLSATP